jgi:hypothetical protein
MKGPGYPNDLKAQPMQMRVVAQSDRPPVSFGFFDCFEHVGGKSLAILNLLLKLEQLAIWPPSKSLIHPRINACLCEQLVDGVGLGGRKFLDCLSDLLDCESLRIIKENYSHFTDYGID